MFALQKIGERAFHGPEFEANRPNGYPVYLILLIQTPASFLVEDAWQSVCPGSAIVYAPGQAHHYKATGNCYMDSWLWASFQPSFLEGQFPFGQPFALHHVDHYQMLFHLLSSTYYSPSPHQAQIVHNLGSALLSMLAEEVQVAPHPALYDSLVQLRREIYLHPEKPWSVADMAQSVAISSGYLQKLYKEYFGISCMQELIQSRVQSACELLDSTSLPIERIAEACGYQNPEHFSRQFKATMGVTPGNYRKGPPEIMPKLLQDGKNQACVSQENAIK